MEEEKRHAMSPKEVIEFFNYPKSTVYDQWKAWNSFKKNDAHRKNRSRSLGATRTDEFVAEAKRKVNEDGNKSYAKLAAEMLQSSPGWTSGLSFRPQVDGDPGVAVGGPPLPLEPGLYFFWGMVENKTNKHTHNTLDSLRAAIVEEFANMKKDVVVKACGRFRHRLEMVVAADEGYIEK
ncbi:Uncharacterized protein FKW44_017053 [Caligus rogercresseyi]|uniref:Uncharacterized protein n=1 Tax=Caligus rogercresseyi TaxID=217165 RepID=A0A7T8K0V3_CALRO|nr:Uncharacterized protein FKW44_017053 [Caligus rogercresseyi]